MISKTTFANDAEANAFFREHQDKDGCSTIYIVKYIIVNSPVTREQEQHLIYSESAQMKNGMHLRKGA
jgi:hypothetical protein